MSGPSMHNAGGCFYRVLLVCILLSFACGHDMTWWHSFLIPSKALHFWGHYCAGHSASALAANVPELARARRDGRGPVCNAPGARQPPKPLPAAGRLGALSVYQPTCTRITLSDRSFRFGSVLRIVAEHLLGTHNARASWRFEGHCWEVNPSAEKQIFILFLTWYLQASQVLLKFFHPWFSGKKGPLTVNHHNAPLHDLRCTIQHLSQP